MIRPLLVPAAALLLAAPLTAADKDWVGKDVMPRVPDLKIGNWDANDRQTFAELRYVVYGVVKEQDGWLRVRNRGQEGWVEKKDWVPLADAPAHYAARIRADRDDSWAWSCRGSAWDNLGEYENAIKDFTEAIRLNPSEADYYNRALAYRKTKDYDRAIKDFNEAIRLDPADSDHYLERGIAWEQKKDWGRALKDYADCMRLAPDSSSGWNGRAWVLATCPDADLRDGKKAVELATKAVELTDRKDHGCLDTLAAAHAEAGDFDKAVKYQKQALAADGVGKEEEADYRARLKLYEGKKPYRQAAE